MSERANTHTNSLPILGKSSSNNIVAVHQLLLLLLLDIKDQANPKKNAARVRAKFTYKDTNNSQPSRQKVLHSQVTHIAFPVFGYTSRRNAIHYKTLSLKCIFEARSRSRTLTRTSNDLANVSRKKNWYWFVSWTRWMCKRVEIANVREWESKRCILKRTEWTRWSGRKRNEIMTNVTVT